MAALRGAAAALAALLAPDLTGLGQGVNPVESRPNVLMIAVDDLRPMLGCYGDPVALTPNLDRLAARSVVFDRAYCQFAKCGPSRLSVLGGLRPESVGVFTHSERDMRRFRESHAAAPNLPRWFREHGYHAQSFGKIEHSGWELAGDWSAPPFTGRENEMLEIADEAALAGVPFAERAKIPTLIGPRDDCPATQAPEVPDEALFDGRMTTRAVGTLGELAGGDKPFLLAVGYHRPHLPLVAPKAYYDRYRPDSSWLPENRDPPADAPIFAWFSSDTYAGFAKRVGLKMPDPPRSAAEGAAWNGFELRSYRGVPCSGEIEDALQLRIRRAYLACVSYADAQAGRLLGELDRLGLWESTIVVLWADHGWHLGEQSAWTKMTNYEVATRVPLMIAAPGRADAAGHTSSFAELVDLYPTLCDLAGLPKPEHLEGDSLAPILDDPKAAVKTFARSQFPRRKETLMGYAVRDERFRFVLWRDRKSGEVVARELYDHRTDPGETVNVADRAEHAEAVAALEALAR